MLKKSPGPSKPFEKANGKWTFHIFPNGEDHPQKFGEYDTEELAAAAAYRTFRTWEANGQTYGKLGTITSQSNVRIIE